MRFASVPQRVVLFSLGKNHFGKGSFQRSRSLRITNKSGSLIFTCKEICGGALNGIGNLVLMGKADVGQKSIGAGDDFSQRVLAIPIERATKVRVLKKISRQ
jgi:hypothetical protein